MSYTLYTPYNRPAHQWDNRTLASEIATISDRPLLEVFKRHIPSGGRVLEAGCGLGSFCVWFREQGYSVTGLENQPSVVERAHAEMADVPVELGDVTHIEYPDESFDAYVSLGVIEHFRDGPQPVLQEAFRVLKPGGVAIITVPANTILRRLVSHRARSTYFLLAALCGRKKYFGEYRYSMSELKGFITGAGLSVTEEGVDDYSAKDPRQHIGLNADWPPFRDPEHGVWTLNALGRTTLKILRSVCPESAYCAGWYVVAKKPQKQ